MEPPLVCLAGYISTGQCIRPVRAGKRPTDRTRPIEESFLRDNNQVVLRPFAVVEFDLIKEARNTPPHTEDWIIDPDHRLVQEVMLPPDQRRFLDKYLFPKVSDIFEAEMYENSYIKENTGKRSLGTIRPGGKVDLVIDPKRGGYRLKFRDQSSTRFDLKINDLTFRNYVLWMEERDNISKQEALSRIAAQLNGKAVYLRIGLARGFDPTEKSGEKRCYLQVTGIYSFPDYLDGRCFADFDNSQQKPS